MWYSEVLKALHERLSPTTYLEIGVGDGASLALARCRVVGIDPDFCLTHPVDADVALVRTSADDFFARRDLSDITRGLPVDLAFINGLHLVEFALRDVINAERHSGRRSVIVLNHSLPRHADQAARARQGRDWTGDVFRLTAVLRRYRPDLLVLPLDTEPTGMLLVAALDPASTVLVDAYDAILAEYRQPDPQLVPPEVLDRTDAVPAERLLASDLLDALADRASDAAAWHERVLTAARACAGPAFVSGRA